MILSNQDNIGYLSDFDLIKSYGQFPPGLTFEYNEEHTFRLLKIVYYHGSEVRKYSPHHFIHILLYGYLKEINGIKKLEDQYAFAVECRELLLERIDFITLNSKGVLDLPIKEYDLTYEANRIKSKCETIDILIDNERRRRERKYYWVSHLIAAMSVIVALLALIQSYQAQNEVKEIKTEIKQDWQKTIPNSKNNGTPPTVK